MLRIYIFRAVTCNQTVGISACPSSLLSSCQCDNPIMPRKGKRSQTAKKKRDGAHAAFGKDAARVTSPERSDYHVLDDDSDEAVIYVDSNDDTSDEEVQDSVEAVQRLYSVFNPPEMRLERLEEETREKRRKATNRQPVYTGSSRTTLWRKNATLKEAAKGCATLDTFIVRKVCT
jgi:hypothetical protein